MKWRTVQLGNDLCKQDKIILDLFATAPVRYIGNDNIFAKNLNILKENKIEAVCSCYDVKYFYP